MIKKPRMVTYGKRMFQKDLENSGETPERYLCKNRYWINSGTASLLFLRGMERRLKHIKRGFSPPFIKIGKKINS